MNSGLCSVSFANLMLAELQHMWSSSFGTSMGKSYPAKPSVYPHWIINEAPCFSLGPTKPRFWPKPHNLDLVFISWGTIFSQQAYGILQHFRFHAYINKFKFIAVRKRHTFYLHPFPFVLPQQTFCPRIHLSWIWSHLKITRLQRLLLFCEFSFANLVVTVLFLELMNGFFWHARSVLVDLISDALWTEPYPVINSFYIYIIYIIVLSCAECVFLRIKCQTCGRLLTVLLLQTVLLNIYGSISVWFRYSDCSHPAAGQNLNVLGVHLNTQQINSRLQLSIT